MTIHERTKKGSFSLVLSPLMHWSCKKDLVVKRRATQVSSQRGA